MKSGVMKEPEERNPRAGSRGDETGLNLVMRHLQREIGLNLKQYKPNYLRRRIGVRMRATGCADYMQYHQYMRQNPTECRRLVNDLTINVTEFFRDKGVYEAIRKTVIPEILEFKRLSGTRSIRVWSAGCATGEEPYSICIMFLQAIKAEEAEGEWALRVTATDLDDKALDIAKTARYEEVSLLPGMDVSEFFVQEGKHFLVRDEVKRPIRFMIMDVVKHPPLRHLDLVLCRNVLIYFEKEKQKAILQIFNRCLRKGGFLVLGKSEAILGAEDSGFAPHIRLERIYRKEKGV